MKAAKAIAREIAEIIVGAESILTVILLETVVVCAMAC